MSLYIICSHWHNIYIYIRAVKVNALIYEIIVAEINAIKLGLSKLAR